MNSSKTTDAQDNPEQDSAQSEVPLAEQLTAAKKEAADNYDRFVRSAADLENFRRRSVSPIISG